ncbi:MAG TPA: HAD family phosphatase [Thermoflexales bacterium]|nr:HAD family phosphatase [Thermoflexales bacterium]HQW35085.1 HAD family phosphatase [Thermoflexales bacterium]HRA01542.1 HAD family phosphatase [Thermoflexales bacterium]
MQKFHPRAVIFDMDGLLLDTEPIAHTAWSRAFAEAGVTLREDVYPQIIGRTSADTNQYLCEAHNLTESAIHQIANRKNELLRQAYERTVPVKEGALDLLSALDARGIPRAIATSTYRDLALHKLQIAGLIHFFNAVVCGDEVKRGKPAPDIFLAAASKLGQPPEVCLVLEDAVPGARAAVAAHIRVIIVPDQVQPPPEVAALAWRVCGSLGEVNSFLFAGQAQPFAPGA